MRLLLRLLLNALAIIIVARIVPGIHVDNFLSAFLAGLVIAIINTTLRPIMQVLSLPATVLTLGFFALIVNAVLFWLASALVPGFVVVGFWAAFWGSIVFWILSMFTNAFLASELKK